MDFFYTGPVTWHGSGHERQMPGVYGSRFEVSHLLDAIIVDPQKGNKHFQAEHWVSDQYRGTAIVRKRDVSL